MKASTLKRPADIGQAVDRASLQPLVLVAMAKFDPVDRDAYWDGDDAVLTRYGGRDGAESSPGTSIPLLSVSILIRCRNG